MYILAPLPPRPPNPQAPKSGGSLLRGRRAAGGGRPRRRDLQIMRDSSWCLRHVARSGGGSPSCPAMVRSRDHGDRGGGSRGPAQRPALASLHRRAKRWSPPLSSPCRHCHRPTVTWVKLPCHVKEGVSCSILLPQSLLDRVAAAAAAAAMRTPDRGGFCTWGPVCCESGMEIRSVRASRPVSHTGTYLPLVCPNSPISLIIFDTGPRTPHIDICRLATPA